MTHRNCEVSWIIEDVSSLVKSTETRVVMGDTPELAPLVPQLDALYELSMRTLCLVNTLPKPLKTLLEEAERLDGFYDRKLKGILGVLESVSLSTTDTALRKSLRDIAQTLFPEGVLGATHSYLRQAGYGVVADMRLTLEMKTALESISFDSRTLYNDYNIWVDTGRALGELETRWERMLETYRDVVLSPTDVRNLKIRYLHLFEQLFDITRYSLLIDEEKRIFLLSMLYKIDFRYRNDERIGLIDETVNERATMMGRMD